MQNWSQPGTGRDLSETAPDPPGTDEPTAPDEPAEWDEFASAGPGRVTSPNDVLVAGGPLAQPADEPAEEPAAAAVARPDSAAPAEPEEPAAHHGGSKVLESAAADGFQERWRDVQFGFVDDPRDAARRAGELAAEVLDAFTAELSSRKRSLDDDWRTGRGEPPDTERLRIAVRAYREFVDRLLNT
jgi:hypothetical protein